jgi:hypothetical protein
MAEDGAFSDAAVGQPHARGVTWNSASRRGNQLRRNDDACGGSVMAEDLNDRRSGTLYGDGHIIRQL